MFGWITDFLNAPAKLKATQNLYRDSLIANDKWIAKVDELENEIQQKRLRVSELENQITIPDPKEEYWNNRYPKQEITYTGRAFFNSKIKTPVDVKIFFQASDFNLEKIVNKNWSTIGKLNTGTLNERALKCLRWVKANFKYKSDKEVVGLPEFWMFPFEALYYKQGDCDDGAILLANLMTVAGIPYWRIRLNAGEVKGGGHCYVTYCCEKNNEFVVLDWCYQYDETPIANRPPHNNMQDYYDIWFSWNERYAFGKMTTMKKAPKDFKVKK